MRVVRIELDDETGAMLGERVKAEFMTIRGYITRLVVRDFMASVPKVDSEPDAKPTRKTPTPRQRTGVLADIERNEARRATMTAEQIEAETFTLRIPKGIDPYTGEPFVKPSDPLADTLGILDED